MNPETNKGSVRAGGPLFRVFSPCLFASIIQLTSCCHMVSVVYGIHLLATTADIEWTDDARPPCESQFTSLANWEQLIDDSDATCLNVFSARTTSHFRLKINNTVLHDFTLKVNGSHLECHAPVLDVFVQNTCLALGDGTYLECQSQLNLNGNPCMHHCICPAGCDHVHLLFSRFPFITLPYETMQLCSIRIIASWKDFQVWQQHVPPITTYERITNYEWNQR